MILRIHETRYWRNWYSQLKRSQIKVYIFDGLFYWMVFAYAWCVHTRSMRTHLRSLRTHLRTIASVYASSARNIGSFLFNLLPLIIFRSRCYYTSMYSNMSNDIVTCINIYLIIIFVYWCIDKIPTLREIFI